MSKRDNRVSWLDSYIRRGEPDEFDLIIEDTECEKSVADSVKEVFDEMERDKDMKKNRPPISTGKAIITNNSNNMEKQGSKTGTENSERVTPSPSDIDGTRRVGDFVAKTPADNKKNVTAIAVGTTVTGDITVEGDLDVCGAVNGNITCSGNFNCSGKIVGDVKAKNVGIINSGNVTGNVEAAEVFTIGANGVVIGDIHAADTNINGRIKGMILCKGMTNVGCNAIIIGNIETDKFTVSQGSRFFGTVKMSGEDEMDKLFTV